MLKLEIVGNDRIEVIEIPDPREAFIEHYNHTNENTYARIPLDETDDCTCHQPDSEATRLASSPSRRA